MITIVYLIAAMTTILLLTEQNFRKKRGYIIFDHIDIQVEVESVPFEDIAKAPKGEPSAAIRERVLKARQIQSERYKGVKGIHCNAQMTTSLLQQHVQLDDAAFTFSAQP